MKRLILLLLIGIFWNISNAEKCDCGKFYKKKTNSRKNLRNTRIFKGREVSINEKFRYPWQIFLKMFVGDKGKEGINICGGSLISRNRHALPNPPECQIL